MTVEEKRMGGEDGKERPKAKRVNEPSHPFPFQDDLFEARKSISHK